MNEVLKEYYTLHYGTCNLKEIGDIQEKLMSEKNYMRVDYCVKINKDYNDFDITGTIYFFTNLERIIGRQRAFLHKHGAYDELTEAEKNVIAIDRKILENGFVNKGYTRKSARFLAEKIYDTKDITKTKSIRARDYVVDSLLNVTEKTEIERYNTIKKRESKEKIM